MDVYQFPGNESSTGITENKIPFLQYLRGIVFKAYKQRFWLESYYIKFSIVYKKGDSKTDF